MLENIESKIKERFEKAHVVYEIIVVDKANSIKHSFNDIPSNGKEGIFKATLNHFL